MPGESQLFSVPENFEMYEVKDYPSLLSKQYTTKIKFYSQDILYIWQLIHNILDARVPE